MKTIAAMLSACLMTGVTALSQTTSPDTLTVFDSAQLRAAALIFAEHAFLKKENALLHGQVSVLQDRVSAGERMIADYSAALLRLEQNRAEADRARDALSASYREELKQQRRKTRRHLIAGIAAGVAAGVVTGAAVF